MILRAGAAQVIAARGGFGLCLLAARSVLILVLGTQKHLCHFYLFFLCGEKGRGGKRLQALCGFYVILRNIFGFFFFIGA